VLSETKISFTLFLVILAFPTASDNGGWGDIRIYLLAHGLCSQHVGTGHKNKYKLGNLYPEVLGGFA
jgi:hypothetical protein